MKYAEMSDFEINCAVARALGEKFAIPTPEKPDPYIYMAGNTLSLLNADGTRIERVIVKDWCNLWADAGPIIEKHMICLAADVFAEPQDGGRWVAQPAYGWDSERVRHDNPLRAAMIVFLMKENANGLQT